MSHDRKGWTRRKPYCREPGYVASLKCRLGGWIVVYDRDAPDCDIPANDRWIVRHLPTKRLVSVSSEARARQLMKTLASARDHEQQIVRAMIGGAP